MGNIRIKYQFALKDGGKVEHTVEIDRNSLRHIRPEIKDPPTWLLLDNKKCENCPLKSTTNKYCPVVYGLHGVINLFKGKHSYTEARIEVTTEQRSYVKQTNVQEGLFSIFGLIMAAEMCPHLEFFRPLVKFHLPFATREEALFRSISMFLLRSYYGDHSMTFADALKILNQKFREIQLVNKGLLERIKSISEGDAGTGAVIQLTTLGQYFKTEYRVDFDFLSSIFKDEPRTPSS